MSGTKEQIERHFRQNIERIDNLLEIYDEITEAGRGRRQVRHQDLLRAAVTFVHAALEDVVRSVAEWKLPQAGKDDLTDVGLPGLKSNQFHLGYLTYHRGKSVDELLEESVNAYLDESNFNEPGEVEDMLSRCGLSNDFVANYKSDLEPMMKRRHWIVHRMDRNYSLGSGHHVARSISMGTVENWKAAVVDVAEHILEQL
jgi:hypothetical protein